MGRGSTWSPEVRGRAVRMVREHRGDYDAEWAAITSIANKIGWSAETLRTSVRRDEIDTGATGMGSTYEAAYVLLTQLRVDALVTPWTRSFARTVEGIVATAAIDALARDGQPMSSATRLRLNS